jgi:hypothetical protein
MASRSGVLIGVGATCVVNASLESCGMTWNQPSPTTLSPALCAWADSDAHVAIRYRQRFSRSQKLFHFVSLRLQAVMRTPREKTRALFACSRS